MSTNNVKKPPPSDSIGGAPANGSAIEPGISRRQLLASASALGAGMLLPGAGVAAATRALPAAQDAVEIIIDVHKDILDEAETLGQPVEGGFGVWWEAEVFTTHLQTFNDENPNVKAKVDWFPGRPQSEKILAKKASGQLGDVVHGLGLPLDVAARNEVYQPLDDLVQSANFDLGQFFPNVIDALRFDPATGKRGAGAPLYALPSQGNPGAVTLFYNADMFAAKGVAVPTTDMTWDTLVETAVQMTVREEGAEVADVYGWLVSPFWFGDVYTTWLRDFGGDMFDETGTKATLDTQEAQAFMQFIYDAIYTQGFSPRPDLLESLGQYKNMFLQQKLAMFRLPPWGVLATSDLPAEGEKGYFKWDAITMPAGPSGQRGSSLGAGFIGLSPDSEHPAEAFEVLAWVTNQEAGVFQCFNAGMCGPRADVHDDERVVQNPFVSVANSSFASAKPPVYAANGRDAEAIAALGTEFDKLINDQVKPGDEFFTNVNKLVQDVLDQSAT